MSRRPLYSQLSSVAPAPPSVMEGIETVDDLERILALPSRPPVDCQRDPVTKKYPPATRALIEVVTASYARPPRVSCACRPRTVFRGAGDQLMIFRRLPEGQPPEPPVVTTVGAFVADNQSCKEDQALARAVAALRPGQSLEPQAADGDLGHPCILEFNAVQAWTLHEAPQTGGIVGFKGVGCGKTVSGLLAPLAFPDCRLAVLVMEPKQRRHYRSHYLRLREHFRVTSIVFDDGQPGHTVAGTPPLHLISYSVLSQRRNTDWLDQKAPDVLILDEAHRACGQSAINRRVKRYVLAKIKEREQAASRGEPVRQRALRLLDWSGTLENKSIRDTHMLCTYSLGSGSPLPLHPSEAEAWSAVIDPLGRPDRTSSTARKLQRAFAGRVYDSGSVVDTLLDDGPEEDIRKGLCARRASTLGVISASASSVNASIYFTERVPPKMPPAVKEALSKVRNEWLRPDGEELVEKIEQVAAARNVGSGFYNYWAFPKHPCSCPNPGNPPKCARCILLDDWYARRKVYNKVLRTKLLKGEAQLDSPALCEEAAARFYDETYTGSLPRWECPEWKSWKEIEGKVEYEERSKWIDDWLARDAAEWATTNKGIVWFQSIAFGRRVAELAKLPYFNGGPGAEERLRAEKGDRSIICSIPAHGAGTDGLQYVFSKQLLAEIPASNSSARGIEQVLGRLHREGQPADVVETQAYLHIYELTDALRKAIAQAEFNYSMTGNRQKILCADLEVEGF